MQIIYSLLIIMAGLILFALSNRQSKKVKRLKSSGRIPDIIRAINIEDAYFFFGCAFVGMGIYMLFIL